MVASLDTPFGLPIFALCQESEMSKPRVLVVDDDNLMRQMVRDDLAAAG